MIALFNYLLIFNVFAGGFVLFTSPFEFYLGYIFIISFLIMYILRYRNISINRNFLIILIVLTISSLVNVYLGKDSIFLTTKQVLGILITGSAYYLLIKVNNYEINKLFKIYLEIALIVAAIGIFQEFSFLVGFRSGYDYSWMIQKWRFIPATGGMLRVNSIFMEPTHLAVSMAPALFVSLAAILRNNSFYLTKKASILIIICYILTFSVIAYIAISISLILILRSYVKKLKHLLLLAVTSLVLIYSAYYYIPEIRMRVDDAIGVATGTGKISGSHLTVFAYTSSAFVAFKSFISSPLFGRGLGSHLVSYDEFIRPGNVFWQKGYTGVNKADANSLFLRLVSETGLFGILVVFYFIFKFRLKRGDNKNLQIISNAIFILFVIQLIRQGHYFYNGLFFFVWMYYFVYKIYNKSNLKISE